MYCTAVDNTVCAVGVLLRCFTRCNIFFRRKISDQVSPDNCSQITFMHEAAASRECSVKRAAAAAGILARAILFRLYPSMCARDESESTNERARDMTFFCQEVVRSTSVGPTEDGQQQHSLLLPPER